MSSTTWKHINGTLHQITCKGANVVGTIRDKEQGVYQRNYNDDGWTKLPQSEKVVWAAAGIDYSVWCCNSADMIFRWNAATDGWMRMPGSCVQIDAWTKDRAVCVNAKQEMFEFEIHHDTWTKLSGVGTHITIGANNEKWHVNSAGSIYRMLPGQSQWQQIPGNLKLKSIHCTDSNNIAGVDTAGKLHRWNASASNWTQLSGLGTHIGITWGNMWHVNEGDAIYQTFT